MTNRMEKTDSTDGRVNGIDVGGARRGRARTGIRMRANAGARRSEPETANHARGTTPCAAG
ncbi:hypothetical protein BHQ31_25450 [Burkholderia cenocepacia]|nr:hypothetical protein BHQ31_25450 [Burkholderia cenocepacia]